MSNPWAQVGQAVIQLAKARGLKTINFIRNRKGVEETKRELEALGADLVWTYDDLKDKDKISELREMPGGKVTHSLLLSFRAFLTGTRSVYVWH